MWFDCFYAVEEDDGQGGKRWVFAIEGSPKVPINGEPGSIEAFQHYCQIAAAHGLSASQAYAPITRKQAKELGVQAKAAARARIEAERRRKMLRDAELEHARQGEQAQNERRLGPFVQRGLSQAEIAAHVQAAGQPREAEPLAGPDAERARRDEHPPPVVEQPSGAPCEETELPAGPSESAGVPPGEPPRRRSRERGPARFKEKDIVRAIRAARKAKLEIAAIRIEPDGTILIIPGTPPPVASPNPWDEPNPLDEVLGLNPPPPATLRPRRR